MSAEQPPAESPKPSKTKAEYHHFPPEFWSVYNKVKKNHLDLKPAGLRKEINKVVGAKDRVPETMSADTWSHAVGRHEVTVMELAKAYHNFEDGEASESGARSTSLAESFNRFFGSNCCTLALGHKDPGDALVLGMILLDQASDAKRRKVDKKMDEEYKTKGDEFLTAGAQGYMSHAERKERRETVAASGKETSASMLEQKRKDFHRAGLVAAAKEFGNPPAAAAVAAATVGTGSKFVTTAPPPRGISLENLREETYVSYDTIAALTKEHIPISLLRHLTVANLKELGICELDAKRLVNYAEEHLQKF